MFTAPIWQKLSKLIRQLAICYVWIRTLKDSLEQICSEKSMFLKEEFSYREPYTAITVETTGYGFHFTDSLPCARGLANGLSICLVQPVLQSLNDILCSLIQIWLKPSFPVSMLELRAYTTAYWILHPQESCACRTLPLADRSNRSISRPAFLKANLSHVTISWIHPLKDFCKFLEFLGITWNPTVWIFLCRTDIAIGWQFN